MKTVLFIIFGFILSSLIGFVLRKGYLYSKTGHWFMSVLTGSVLIIIGSFIVKFSIDNEFVIGAEIGLVHIGVVIIAIGVLVVLSRNKHEE